MVRSRWAAVNRNCRIASQSSTERRSRENDADPHLLPGSLPTYISRRPEMPARSEQQ